MKKYLLMIIFSSFVGIFSNPEILSASNSVSVSGLNNAGIVETVAKPVVKDVTPAVSYVAPAENYSPSYNYSDYSYDEPASSKTSTTEYYEPAYGAVSEPDYISFWVSAYTNSIEVNPSYYDIYQTGKLIYAHNTSDLLYNLNYLYAGDIVKINGNLYKVSDRVVYEKTDDYSLNGDRSVMRKLKNNAYGHTFALMTCYGTYYGNGDASHRLVIFADAM